MVGNLNIVFFKLKFNTKLLTGFGLNDGHSMSP